ncbi:MAG: hypothetical protein ACO1N9_05295 [Flavobacterium sp.]
MKRLLFFLVACITLSCGDDDITQPNFENNGIGNPYTGSVIGIRKTVRLNVNGEDVNLSCTVENASDKNFAFEFHDDNTFHLYHNCDPDAEIVGTGTYNTTGNVLTLNLNGQTGKAHMVYVGNDMLEFRFTIGSSGLFYNHNFTVLNV